VNEPGQPRPATLLADTDDAAIADGRLRRGARSRRTILRHAVDIASLDGLDGLSLGRLASDLGISKSGVQTLFGTKEELQVAVAEFAREAFNQAVVGPASTARRGTARLRAIIERWILYAQEPLFAGGCFWAANLSDFDSRPGPVRDTLIQQQRAWRELIAGELRHAAEIGEIAELDADLAAFELDAVLTAVNTAMRLGEPSAGETARRVLEALLTPPGKTRAR
jgi:AcrR family transcriptional regulator